MLRQISRLFSATRSNKPVPDDPEIVAGRSLLEQGRVEDAIALCRKILAAEPGHAGANHLLGGIMLQLGRAEQAGEFFGRAARSAPDDFRFPQGQGIACCQLGRLPEALHHFQRARALDPRNPSILCNLGNYFRQAGNEDEALDAYRKAVAADSGYLLALLNLGDLLDHQLKHKQAAKTFRQALKVSRKQPDNTATTATLHHRLGYALSQLEQTDAAIEHYRQAIDLQPDLAVAHNSLGGAFLARNELHKAIDCFRQALDLEPGYSRVHSNLLLTMNYLPAFTQREIFSASEAFHRQHAEALMRGRKPFCRPRNKQKTLRIGYLSPDFREHSVAFFTRRLFGSHNDEAVSVYCYADVARPDDVTGQFRAQADQWRVITQMDDESVARQIRDDGIDILVDLAGHTGRNRLLVFARKPAPVQVSWLGYPNTTGLRAIDYRLTDAIADPPAEEALYSETLFRLEHGFLCYQNEERLRVSEPPSKQRGHITFGSFNTIKKVTPEVIAAWSAILQALPDSKLILKSNALQDATTKAGALAAFSACGIDAARIELRNSVPRRQDHMQTYADIDIALDPFPYNGTTTTCEALWMGVPVISLRGDRHAGRVGASILEHAGLAELVAETGDAYQALAIELARDPARLASLRHGLRERMSQSALMDLTGFTRTLEDAYRQMWIKWCNRRK